MTRWTNAEWWALFAVVFVHWHEIPGRALPGLARAVAAQLAAEQLALMQQPHPPTVAELSDIEDGLRAEARR